MFFFTALHCLPEGPVQRKGSWSPVAQERFTLASAFLLAFVKGKILQYVETVFVCKICIGDYIFNQKQIWLRSNYKTILFAV